MINFAIPIEYCGTYLDEQKMIVKCTIDRACNRQTI